MSSFHLLGVLIGTQKHLELVLLLSVFFSLWMLILALSDGPLPNTSLHYR